MSPWNYEDHIDIDTTAELFIRRMTGECSYLDGEDVLAKNSLLYEKYCFFNELASLSFTEDGDSWMPFDAGMRKAIYDAASDGKTMTVKRIESVLQRDFFIAHPHVRGTSNPKAMSSKRSNYAYFCRLFDVKALSASDMSMAEDLVLWNTVFEDRDILRRKILKTYGDLLTEKAVDDFCHKRLSGWGKLSERLLTGIWADTASGDLCVMDVLEQGRPYGRYRGSSMNLMQILNDDVLGFKMEIKRLNDSHMQMTEGFDLNALPGSPALRRGVSQAMKVLDDIVSVAGKAPDRIYLKVTRTASNSRKGKRTAKRSDKIKLALKALDADAAADLGAAKLLRELGMFDEKEINERIYLYFHQAGKCLYTGKPIDITRIASNDYYVDHVVPLAYRKDESLDNKVLVYAEASRYKSETMLVSPAVQRKMLPFWRMLRNAGLMSERKLNALIRTEISEGMLKSIIGRQFTENSCLRLRLRQSIRERLSFPLRLGLSVPCAAGSEFRKALKRTSSITHTTLCLQPRSGAIWNLRSRRSSIIALSMSSTCARSSWLMRRTRRLRSHNLISLPAVSSLTVSTRTQVRFTGTRMKRWSASIGHVDGRTFVSHMPHSKTAVPFGNRRFTLQGRSRN